MKSNMIIGFLACILTGLISQSCSDITSMQREYLDRGETLYVGRLDSIKFRGGLHRVQMEGSLRYARSASRCVISWNDQSQEYDLADISRDDTAKVLIDNLDEGTYRFTIQTFDDAGNKSVKEECYGYVYGDEYILTQSPKFISEMIPDPYKMTLKWNVSDNAIKVRFSYENSNGEMISQILPGDVKTTEISNWKKGGKIECITYTLPEKNALDTIPLDPYLQSFPTDVEYEIDKSTFKAVGLPTDIAGNGYGGKIEGIWDGVIGSGEPNRYHSADGEGIPHHLTFDMGVYADLTQFKIYGRVGYSNWNPKHFQLWGIDSIEDAETSLPSADPGWEAEAKEKGWKLLIDATCNDPEVNTFTFDKDKVKNVRYIRYRVLEVFGPPSTGSGAYGCVQEMTFWADQLRLVGK